MGRNDLSGLVKWLNRGKAPMASISAFHRSFQAPTSRSEAILSR